MKSFKRFLSEEEQGPRDFDKWYFMISFQYFGESGSINNEGFLYRFRISTGLRSLGSPYVTQTMLDHFDFNGDGIIGQNDIAYGQIVAYEIFQYALENGIDNVPPFMNAAEWRQNWESINQQYGFDFPNPDEFFGTPDDPTGNLPDTWNPDDAVRLSVDFLPAVVDGWTNFTNAVSSTATFADLYPEMLAELLQMYDFNGNGKIDGGFPPNPNQGYNVDSYLAYFIFEILAARGFDTSQQLPESLFGAEGFANLVQTYFYTRGDMSDTLSVILQRIIDAGYVIPELPTSPPPPPEETPQAQAPRPEIGGLG